MPSTKVFRKLQEINKICDGFTYLTNRNPRNLEKMRIAYKPSGYHLDKPGRNFWHKLELNSSGRYVTAKIIHFESGAVMQASTMEWAIKKHLYKTNDSAAYINLARIFAQRCLESGLTNVLNTIEAQPNSKVDKFIKTLEANGICLTEGERYVPYVPRNMGRAEKPWEVTE